MSEPSVAVSRTAQGERAVPFLSILAALMGIGLAALIIIPLGNLLFAVFFTSSGFSDHDIVATLSDPRLATAMRNTAILVLGAGTIAVATGSALAWFNERTDARLGWAAELLTILPLLVPVIAGAAGWVFLFAPQAGFLNVALRALTGAVPGTSGPVNIYTLGGMVFVIAIYTIPFAYLVVSGALRNLDPALEEASRMSGAGPWRTLGQVTLPAIRNAVATSAVLVLMTSIAAFSVPVLLGLPAGIDVLTTLIYRAAYASFPPRVGDAVVLSVFMLLVVQVAVLVEYVIRRRGHHAQVGGRAAGRTRVELGFWRIPVRIVMVVYVALATVLPVAALVLVSLQPFWTSTLDWAGLSLANYTALFSAQNALTRAFLASLVLGVVAATALMAVATVLDVAVSTRPGRLGRLLSIITTFPSGLPHTVIAIAFLVTLGVGSGRLGGTYHLLFLAYLVLLIPQASRAAGAAMGQLGRDVWEASLMSGAGQLRTFTNVLVPLMLGGLIAGWVVVFVGTFSEVSAGAFLSGTRNPVVGPLILEIWQNSGTFPQLAALTLMVTVVQTVVVLVVLAASRGRFGRRTS